MDIIFYLRGDDVVALIVDVSNAKLATKPTITRGLHPILKIRPIHIDGTPFTAAELNYASWDFGLYGDWNTATAGEIRVQTGVTVATVAVLVSGVSVDYAEIRIPLTATNTNELITKLNNGASVDLGAELVGIPSGETDPGLVWQWDMTVRNRRSTAGTGTPTPVGDGIYSSSQVDSLLEDKADAVAGTTGDMMFYNGTGWAVLPIGSAGQVLKVTGGIPVWSTP